MWRRAAIWGVATLVGGGAIGVAPAGADSTPAGDFSFRLFSSRPGTAAGLEFRQLYKNPQDANAKPSPVRRFLFAAPEGLSFDGSAMPRCQATDEQFQLIGRAACPPASVVGTGFITVLTGAPGEAPFPADATVFNSGDGIIELFTMRGTGSFLAIERPKFRGRSAFEDTDIAVTPGGPPDGMSAAREAYLRFPLSRGPGGKSFITTPATCPSTKRWTARFEWANADGTSHRNKHDMRCSPGSAATTAPSGCLARRVRIGRRNIGRLRLLQTRARTLRRARPRSTRPRLLRYCVRGPDRRARSVAVFDRRARLRVALTNARGHRREGIGRGSSLAALRGRFGTRMRGLEPDLWIVRSGDRRHAAVVFKVARKRVSYVALADSGLAAKPTVLRRYLRRGEP